MRRARKGQSILEYVIVLTVIVAAIAVAAKAFIDKGVKKALQDSGSVIESATGKLPGVAPAGTPATQTPVQLETE